MTMHKILFSFLCISAVPVYAQHPFQLSAGSLPAAAGGGNTMDAQAADLNGDGHLDLVLAKEWQRNLVLFNNGEGVFTDSGSLTNVGHDSEDIAIADLDGNGWLDIVFASEDDAVHEIYLNTGSGIFSDVSTRLPQFISNSVVAADLDMDGFPDLIFGNAGQDRIFINNGNGEFTDETAFRLPAEQFITQDLLLVDVDNDGDLDLMAGNEDGNRLLINDGNGVFSDETLLRLPQGIVMETRKVSKADIDGDGFDDLFFCNMASSAGKDIRDRLYLNDGNGVFTDITETHLPDEELHSFDAVFTDLNQDGFPDLIVGYLSNQPPAVWINDGTGSFSAQSSAYLPPAATGNNITVLCADFNDDGKKDLFLGRFQHADRLFLFAENTNNIGSPSYIPVLKIYPNPVIHTVSIDLLSSGHENDCMTILDLAGKKLFSESLNDFPAHQSFDLSHLPDGMYILEISLHSQIQSQKIIIQHL